MSDLTLTDSMRSPASPSLHQYRELLSRYLKPQIGWVLLMAGFLMAGIAIKPINPQVLRYFLDTAQAGGASRSLTTAAALFLVFANLYGFVTFGTFAQFLGHVTFSISFVVIIVRGRLFSIGRDYEEAAMDLGASQLEALRRVLLPMLAPAIFAAFGIVFAISIDDFVISQFLSSGQSSITIPVRLYSTARLAPSPSLKLSTNSALWRKQGDDIDIDCGGIVEGSDTIDDAGERIFRLMLATASGQTTKSERHGYGQQEFVPWALGAVM